MVDYSKEQLENSVKASFCISDVCRNLGLSTNGSARRTLKKKITEWDIDSSHFKSQSEMRRGGTKSRPLEEVLQKGRFTNTAKLKERLYREGIKERKCEMEGCGQDETWRGKKMALIIDHINGDSSDNRLENLRIVCPNCNATLDTHCNRRPVPPKEEIERALEKHKSVRQAAAALGSNWNTFSGWLMRYDIPKPYQKGDYAKYKRDGLLKRSEGPQLGKRKVRERPSKEQLVQMIGKEGYEQVGRNYGVSGNSIRKWMKTYGVDPKEVRRKK